MKKILFEIKRIYYCIFFIFKRNVSVKRNFKIEFGAEVEVAKTARVNIEKSCMLKKNTCLRCRDNSELYIGNNVFFNNSCILTCRKKIKIGNNVIFGPNVMIFDHDHDYMSENMVNNFLYGEIIIGNNVWIGANCIILKGTIIEDNCVIAAGSIVKNTVPKNSVYYNSFESKLKKLN